MVPARGVYLMAFDSRFSRIRRSLPRSASTRQVVDIHIEAHALRQQRQLLVLDDLLDQRPQPELADLEADAAAGLPGAETQQVLDHALQAQAVLAQDAGDLALRHLQLAHGAVHQQFGALADIRQRRLQFVRHVAQEAVAFLRQLEQPQAQPFQLTAQALQIGRSADGDGPVQRAAAQFADGAVDLPQRPAHAQREQQDGAGSQRYQQHEAPEHDLLCTPGAGAQRGRRPCRSASWSASRRCPRSPAGGRSHPAAVDSPACSAAPSICVLMPPRTRENSSSARSVPDSRCCRASCPSISRSRASCAA